MKKECIRNINIKSQEPDKIGEINKKLSNSYAYQDIAIANISKKADDFLTVKCLTPEEAKKMEQTLKVEFGDKLLISTVKDSEPQVKIINLDSALSDTDLILNLKEQNHWLRNTNIAVKEKYQVPTSKGKYTNVILSCDLTALKILVEKGTLICGFDEKKVYEHVSILQYFSECLQIFAKLRFFLMTTAQTAI